MECSIECEVCFVEYNSNDHCPKSLPCGHTMCAECVKDNLSAREGQMNCPFCRTPCGRGVKNLDDFPTTFALLNLVGANGQNGPSQINKEKENLQQRKQVEYDCTEAHILNCNEHLIKLAYSREKQHAGLYSISQRKNKLLEELNTLEEEKNKATSLKKQLDDIFNEGYDIVKGLKALQDRGKIAISLLGMKMASQDVQKYSTASQKWVKSRAKRFLEEEERLTKENKICSKKIVTPIVECRRQQQPGLSIFISCKECRAQNGSMTSIMCGSCFLNSAHLNHKFETLADSGNGFCDCGIKHAWKRDPTCRNHQRKDMTYIQACNTTLQSTSKCKEVFFSGAICMTCLDCRTMSNVIMCGSCFLNSPHTSHRQKVITISADGAFCDCGCKEAWKQGDSCILKSL
ncbi:unnamed protein product, partial [Meganyctiphanes norvegica]